MSEHVFDELPRLLSGEADRATVSNAAAHLRACEDCRHELISAVVSHAALTSAVRFAPDLTVRDERIVSALADAESLPDLSSIFAQVRQEASAVEPPGMSAPVQRSRIRWLVAASVAAVAVAGAGIAIATNHGGAATTSVALAAYDQGKTSAKVKLVGGHEIKLDAGSLPRLGDGQYYEVWLTDAARVKMAPVGQLNSTGEGDFTVSTSALKTFSAVEVSVQQTAGTGKYSGVSVLRGSYS